MQKTVEQMENNVFYKECLKYSYCLLYQIYSLIINDSSEAYLNLLLPFLYYLSTFNNIQRFFFEKFPKFKQLFCKIHEKVKFHQEKSAKQSLEEETKDNDNSSLSNYKEIIESFLLNNEKNLIGFVPLKKYFVETKKNLKLWPRPDQYEIKLFLVSHLLDSIGCLPDVSLGKTTENLESIDLALPLIEEDLHKVRIVKGKLLLKVIYR